MGSSLRLRAVVGSAALLMSGLLTGCNDQEPAQRAVEASAKPPAHLVGSAVAKGADLTAVAAVRAWIAARDDRWSIGGARVTRQGSRSATVVARIGSAEPRRWAAVEFEVGRIDGLSAVTKISFPDPDGTGYLQGPPPGLAELHLGRPE